FPAPAMKDVEQLAANVGQPVVLRDGPNKYRHTIRRARALAAGRTQVSDPGPPRRCLAAARARSPARRTGRGLAPRGELDPAVAVQVLQAVSRTSPQTCARFV